METLSSWCCLHVTELGSSHEMFESGEDLLDRIEVRAIWWQEDAVGLSGADGFASRFALVAARIVEDDDLAQCECWCQHLLDVTKSSPLMGPSITQGALIRSWPSAPMKALSSNGRKVQRLRCAPHKPPSRAAVLYWF
ncbi:hypothetical protein XI00_06325 [Bradyrhizobium sp. CCBAU 21359]|nr:hypothetical protein [Bradyrhizobium sp. CCBAU 21359]